jgi:WD40 repeat protein/serine/threonine protein kinase
MNPCIPPEQLQRLLAEQLSETERKVLDAHVDACARCQETLVRLLEAKDDSTAVERELMCRSNSAPRSESPEDFLRRIKSRPPLLPRTVPCSANGGPPLDILFPDPPTVAGSLGRLDSYHILEELGRGAFGAVFKAYDEKLDCPVALKVLKPELAASVGERRRFEDEARKAAAVRHDHVVRIYRVGGTPGFALPYYVMEYIDGETLSERLRRQGALEPKEAAEIVRQGALGLEAAHACGQVHRDIKPSNILLEKSSGRAKITDFGLARTQEVRAERLTQTGAIVGTPPYMSPEQITAPQGIDPRSDVYGLGVVLYEMLTGEPPFRGLLHLVLQQVAHEEPRPPRSLNDTIPRDLETICLHCLHKEPSRRYPSAGALAEDLRHFLAGEPIQARPIRPWERSLKWARRRPAIAALTAAVLVITVLGFGLVGWQWLRAEAALGQASEKAKAEAEANRQLEQTLYFNLIALAQRELLLENWGRAEEILAECDERWRDWEWHYLRRLRHAPPLTLALGERTVMGQGFDLAFSPDSRLLALPSGQNTIKVWEVVDGERGALTPRFILRGHTERVLGVAFSPDGQRLASTSEDKTVRIWDLAARPKRGEFLSPRRTLRAHTDRVLGVAFSPDQGRLLATASNDRTVKLWNASTGELLFDLPGQSILHEHVHLAFSPDGRRLASGSKNNTVRVWDVATGQEAFTLVGHAQPVFNVTFSPDGRRLVSASQDGVVKVWDLPPGELGVSTPGGRVLAPRHTLTEHSSGVWCVAFSPDGQRLAVGGAVSDDSVRVYEAATGRPLLALRGHIRLVSVAFHADGRRLASAGFDKTVRLWDTKTGHEILTLGGHTDLVGRVLFSPDGQRLASASADGTVRVWDASPFDEAADRRTTTLRGHSGEVYGLAFSPGGRRLASASADKSIKLWNTTTGQEVLTLDGHKHAVFSVAFSPDARRLVSGSNDKTAKLWDTQNGKVLYTLDGFQRLVRSVAFSPDGRTIATGSVQLVQLWDAETGQELNRRVPADPVLVHCVTFSRDGKHLAAVGTNKTAKVWKVDSGEEVCSFPGHLTRVRSVAFHPKGEYVASGDGDFKVKLWNPTTGREIKTLSGHTDFVEGIAFSPDGRYLATASWREVILWDAKSFKEIQKLGRFAGRIWCVTFSPDGKRLAAAGGYKGKGEIKIWDASFWDKKPTPP